MHLKGPIILLATVLTLPASGQFKNKMLDERTDEHRMACAPAIAINPRAPKNIVAGFSSDGVYYTKDGGETWTTTALTSGVHADPALIADAKGNFFYFRSSGSTSGDDTASPRRLVMQQSDDGGATWSSDENVGSDAGDDQRRGWGTVDARGSLYVSWTRIDRSAANPECHPAILFSMSKNGKKWTEPVTISKLSGDCAGSAAGVPAVTFDGKVFVAWSNQGKIFIDRSFDGGDRWLSNDIVVAEQPDGAASAGDKSLEGRPVLMTDIGKSSYRGSLYVVWSDRRNGANDTDIWFTRSHNFGDNWVLPVRVNGDGGGDQYRPWMTVDQATGNIYVVYYNRGKDDDAKTDVYLAFSADGGTSFRNVKISEEPFTASDASDDYTNISAHNGIVAPVWTKSENGKMSLWTTIINQNDLK